MKKRYYFLVTAVFILSCTVTQNGHAFDDNKNGFLLGLGLGAHHLSRAHNDVTNNGLFTSFRLGYGFSDAFLLYYVNDIAWFNNSGDMTVISALTGIGMNYFVKELNPSLYFGLTLGLGTQDTPFEKNSDPNRGTGYAVSLGYEIASHLVLELTYRKSSLTRDSRPNFTLEPTVVNTLMSYYFY